MPEPALLAPPPLAPGCRVALVAPAGPLRGEGDVAAAVENARAFGWETVVGRYVLAREGYFAGSDDARLADLDQALRDPRIDAVWCLRGGYGMMRLLDAVDFEALARRPRPVIGYSDITALLAGITRRAGVVAFHAPTARAEMPRFTRRHFELALTEPEPAGLLEPLPPPADVLVPHQNRVVTVRGGVAEGPLAGGNLTLLQCLIGSPYFPDLDGALLFLEDVNEDLYRIDRILAHLRMIGALARLRGVLIGQFTAMKRQINDGALGLDEVLAHYFRPLDIPVAHGFPIGHIDDQWTMPLGVRARLDADACTVELLEPAVA